MKKNSKINGYATWLVIVLALAGIIWNAAVLHNDVKHIKAEIKEIKTALNSLK